MKVTPTYGTVIFQAERPEVPKTTKVGGNVTINQMGSPGEPAKYIVKHDFTFSDLEGTVHGQLFLTNDILASSSDGKYQSVETVAFERLPGTLRRLADEIARQLRRGSEVGASDDG